VTESIESIRRPDGTRGEFLVYRFPIPTPGGKPNVGGIAADVTKHRRTERASRLKDLAMESVSQGITISDPTEPENPTVYASPGFLRLVGYELDEVVGRNWRFLHGPDPDPTAEARIRDAIRDGQSLTIVFCSHRKDGTSFWDEVSISPRFDTDGRMAYSVGVHTDVTQKRHLEEQHRQSHKMEAIGQLAGGIAHDFNNLLTVIIAYSDLLLQSVAIDRHALDALAEISKAGNRAASLTRQLLAFSRNQPPSPIAVKLNTVMRDMERMLRRVIGEDIEVSAVLQTGLYEVMADPGQLAQVLLNLSVNARDAMPHGGKLVLETRNVELSEDYAKAHVGVVPGEYVMLSVTDTGIGISEETMRHIFEPNFTTKKLGMGTGLGLTIVQGIVTQCKGFIEVQGELGVGTTFKIYLPRTESIAKNRTPLSIHSKFPRGSENILLVEDERSLRELGRKILEKCGYTVFEAHDSDSALTLAEEARGPIHLLVTDIMLPGASGCMLAERLRVNHPAMRVLFVSGCIDDADVRQGFDRDAVEFLAKPFTPIVFAQTVRQVIDRLECRSSCDHLPASSESRDQG
jgi:PAS domain S-box-containing protein